MLLAEFVERAGRFGIVFMTELPGDWSRLDEPISDADAHAARHEAIGDTGQLLIVQKLA